MHVSTHIKYFSMPLEILFCDRKKAKNYRSSERGSSVTRRSYSHCRNKSCITRRLLFMYVHAEKCHFSAKKINLNFLFFKKIIFVKLIVKEKR